MKNKEFIKKATYPGGKEALRAFIKNNLRYPKEALKNKIEGSVLLKFKVRPTGSTFDIHVLSGIGHGCNKEAIRVVKELKYTGLLNRKIRVTTSKRITIKFRLPNVKTNLTIQYHVIK